MRKHYLSVLTLLFAAFILLGGRLVLKAQQATSSAVKAGRWSDAATWSDRKVPAAGAAGHHQSGHRCCARCHAAALNGLTINGKLSFANNKDLELTTEWIMLHGELEIGTEKAPHTRKATITFTNNVKDEDISGVGGTTTRLTAGSCSWAEP
jgi:cell migration-inducing and hyaluronan-binding protein